MATDDADQDWIDDQMFDEDETEEDAAYDACGRWDQNARGGLLPVYHCRLAGTEQCDFDCPLRNT